LKSDSVEILHRVFLHGLKQFWKLRDQKYLLKRNLLITTTHILITLSLFEISWK